MQYLALPKRNTHTHHWVHVVGVVVAGDDDEDGDEGMEHVIKMQPQTLGLAHLHARVHHRGQLK